MRQIIKNRHEFFVLSKIRSRFVLTILILSFFALFSQAFYLQGMQNEWLQEEGFNRSNRKIILHAYRGKIFDRNGKVLAGSAPVKTIKANPVSVKFKEGQKNKLAKLLKLNPKHLDQKLRNKNKPYVFLKKRIKPKVAAQIMALKIPGITLDKEYQRYYPGNASSAHVVGYLGRDGNGLEGLEMAMNEALSGEDGFKKVLIDAKRKIVDELSEVKVPKDGQDIHLSIDGRLQEKTYEALKKAVDKHEAKSGSAILIDAKSGEVLAMSNFPSYNPNKSLTKTERKNLKNRAITDVFEPGSTVKPISVAVALEKNVVNVRTKINTRKGRYRVGKETISDTHAYGILTVREVVQVSSNIGAVKIAEMITSKSLWSIYNNFGFGRKTEIEFPGEPRGKLRNYESWKEIDHAAISYGYSLNGSLAQIARAYTPFANSGELKPLTLIKKNEPVIGRRVLSTKVSNQMLNILESVVSDGGTAPQAQVPGYRIAGKTGTAKQWLNEKKKYSKKYTASFVGIAPVSKPKFIMAIMIDAPSKGGYYGGPLAGPVFKEVMSEALKLYSIPQDGLNNEAIERQIGVNIDITI